MPRTRLVKGFVQFWLLKKAQHFESGPKDRFDTLSYILFVYAEEQHSLDCQDILAKTKASVNTKIDKETVR